MPANPVSEYALFTQLDTLPPYVYDRYPYPQATDVARNAIVELKVRDGLTAINLQSLDLTIDGHPIFQNGLPIGSGSISLQAISRGYHITWDPDSTIFDSGHDVYVVLECDDEALTPNHLTANYTFRTGTSHIEYTLEDTIPPAGGMVDPETGLYLRIPSSLFPLPVVLNM